MFSLVSGIYDSYLAPTQLNLLVIGAPGAGKTTLLERLKVTQFPKRPSTQSPALSTEELTAALQAAFVEGGATSPNTPLTNDNSDSAGDANESPEKAKTPVAKSPAQSVVVTQKRRRFPFTGICPAPERYSKSKQDQDEEFVEEEHDDIAPTDSQSQSGEETEPLNGLEEVALVSSPTAPRRVRCHSKEFAVQDLDLNESSMEDIPIGNADETPPQSQQQPQQETLEVNNAPLLQSAFEEYNVKPNAKMLPMSKIRPTSKCSMR